jgi:hypothetical protein
MQISADNRQAVTALGESARAVGVVAQKVELANVRIADMAKAFALGQAAFRLPRARGDRPCQIS